MTLPDFLILGAQKAGTTWIRDCLITHPEVYMPEAVELLYFNKAEYRSAELRQAYEAHFARAAGFKRVGEKTPSYFWSTDRARSLTQPPKSHNPDIPGAVKATLGEGVDLIVSLRHPVWRAISAFGHHARRRRIAPDLSLRDVAHKFGILDIGFYGAHLEAWLRAFDRERFLVLIFEDDIVGEPQQGYRKLCEFLGVDTGHKPDNLTTASNSGERRIQDDGIAVGGHPVRVGRQDISFLLDAYEADIALTTRLLGRAIPSWDEETARLRAWCRSGPAASIAPAAKAVAPPPATPAASPDRSGWRRPQAVRLVPRAQLRSHGLDASDTRIANLDERFLFEPPARLAEATVHGPCSFGAFSYMVADHLYSTHVGRYCSIARGVNIGQFNHTMDWLSTSPFQFQQGFVIRSGDGFRHRADYEGTLPDPQLSALARKQLGRTTVIGNDVWIGHGAVIIGGVQIGDGAVIGANAVVTKDVPPYAVVGGVPARVIRHRFDEPTRERLRRTAWWRFAPWQLKGVPFQDIHAALDEIDRRIADGRLRPYEPGYLGVAPGK